MGKWPSDHSGFPASLRGLTTPRSQTAQKDRRGLTIYPIVPEIGFRVCVCACLCVHPLESKSWWCLLVTCSGLRPGGTQAYSSEAQPESSSEMEWCWKSEISRHMMRSRSTGTVCTACSSRGHLQCWQIFLRGPGWGSVTKG